MRDSKQSSFYDKADWQSNVINGKIHRNKSKRFYSSNKTKTSTDSVKIWKGTDRQFTSNGRIPDVRGLLTVVTGMLSDSTHGREESHAVSKENQDRTIQKQ
jgi:hypothetical protein